MLRHQHMGTSSSSASISWSTTSVSLGPVTAATRRIATSTFTSEDGRAVTSPGAERSPG
ncbi:hypothetical protein WME79_42900 [Sorangium sp. So ce726]|uniref:hypothetical protein n=1 Tax=Sorangium sp. So ce726 TaxID=3133319 RepID=UPI003F640A3C